MGYLLENLHGLYNPPSKVSDKPHSRDRVLEMQVDSRSIEVLVPGQKLKQIRLEAADKVKRQAPPTAQKYLAYWGN